MKKLVLMLAAVAAISFASCGDKAAADSDSAKSSASASASAPDAQPSAPVDSTVNAE